MKYSDDKTVYTISIYDGNFLTDECDFEEVDDYEQSFTGTLQEFGERLEYGDFLQEDIKESIKEFESDKSPDKQGHLSGRKYDSIAYEIKQN